MSMLHSMEQLDALLVDDPEEVIMEDAFMDATRLKLNSHHSFARTVSLSPDSPTKGLNGLTQSPDTVTVLADPDAAMTMDLGPAKLEEPAGTHQDGDIAGLISMATENIAKSPPKPSKRKRTHRRARTEGSFDFLYEQKKQETKRQSELGPAEPPKWDPLNVMAHSFLKEEQARLSQTLATPPDVAAAVTPTPAPSSAFESPCSQDEVSEPKAALPMMDQHYYAPTPAPAPEAQDRSAWVTSPNLDQLMAEVAPGPETSIMPQPDSVTGPATGAGTSKLGRFLDQLQAQADQFNVQVQTAPAMTMEQPAATVEMESEQPSKLSRLLDNLQAQADRQNAMLVEQKQRGKKRHRRVVSEGVPKKLGLPTPQLVQPFGMSDLVEDRALYNLL